MNATEVKFASGEYCSTGYISLNQGRASRKKWMEEKELYEATINQYKRIVTPVVPININKVYMMDVVTGSMYDIPTGRCLSSDVLVMKEFIKKKGLHKVLLDFKVDKDGGF